MAGQPARPANSPAPGLQEWKDCIESAVFRYRASNRPAILVDARARQMVSPQRLQELEDQKGGRHRLLDAREVTGAGDLHQPGARYGGGHPLRYGRRRDHILCADQDQGGNAGQRFQQRGTIGALAHGRERTDESGHRNPENDVADLLDQLGRDLGRKEPRQHRLGGRDRSLLANPPDQRVAGAGYLGAVRLRPGIHEDQAAPPLAPPAEKLEGHKAAEREAAQDDPALAQGGEKRGQGLRVGAHRIAEVRRIRLSRAPEVRRDPPEPRERIELVAPDRAVEGKSMNEEDCAAAPPMLDGETYPVDRDPGGGLGCGSGLEELGNLFGHRDGPALAIDADDDELGRGDEGAGAGARGGLTHGEAGAAMMHQRLVHPEHVSRERRRVVVDDRAAERGPRTVAREHVHPGSPRQQVPAGPLEDPKKGRLIEMPESIAVIGIDDLLDVRDRSEEHTSELQRYAGPRRTRYYSAPCSQVRTR